MSEQTVPVIGFVGLGVMGGPMCRNIALKHSGDVIAFDMNSAAFAALDGTKARRAQTLGEVAEQADLVFLSLPGAQQVEQVCLGSRGLASVSHPPSVIVDLSTTTVAVARGVAERLSSKGIAFADAPVARTREAAQRGELSIMVGADEALYARIEPLLRYMGSDVTHCAQRYYAAAATNGWSGRYYPAVIEVVDRNIDLAAQPSATSKA